MHSNPNLGFRVLRCKVWKLQFAARFMVCAFYNKVANRPQFALLATTGITSLQESTLKHFFQTFKQKKRWYHSNEQDYLCALNATYLCWNVRAYSVACSDGLTKPQPPAIEEEIRGAFNSLHFLDNAEAKPSGLGFLPSTSSQMGETF